MLCQFTVKNFKSIRDEMTFDMQATAISEHKDRVIRDNHGEEFLPIAAIYGPNGGGKSNVLEAFNTVISKVRIPLCAACDNEECGRKAKKIVIRPFAFLETSLVRPTEFELFFRTEQAEYRYILHIQNEQIIKESLDRVKLNTGRKSELYLREKNQIQLKGYFGRLKISDGISEKLPLLSYLGIVYRKNSIVSDVIDWFEHKVKFIDYGNPSQEMVIALAKSAKLKKMVLDMLKELSIDIEDFRVEEKDEEASIFMNHVVDGFSSELRIEDESSGTIKIFSLIPYLIESLVYGKTLVIDELDAKLHPLLLKHILMMYNDMDINTKKAQLIITSHDLATMNSEIFRRDEIWFVAKGNKQNSKLYSLVEFKNDNGDSVRKDARYDKQYLEGRYGADPYLRRIIDWGDINA